MLSSNFKDVLIACQVLAFGQVIFFASKEKPNPIAREGMNPSSAFNSPTTASLPNHLDDLSDQNVIFKDKLWNSCGRRI